MTTEEMEHPSVGMGKREGAGLWRWSTLQWGQKRGVNRIGRRDPQWRLRRVSFVC